MTLIGLSLFVVLEISPFGTTKGSGMDEAAFRPSPPVLGPQPQYHGATERAKSANIEERRQRRIRTRRGGEAYEECGQQVVTLYDPPLRSG